MHNSCGMHLSCFIYYSDILPQRNVYDFFSLGEIRFVRCIDERARSFFARTRVSLAPSIEKPCVGRGKEQTLTWPSDSFVLPLR